MFIAPDKHSKRILSIIHDSTFGFEAKIMRMEPVECWRCGSIEMLDVQGVNESDIVRYECADCSVCDSCRHYEGYRCPDWPNCTYDGS